MTDISNGNGAGATGTNPTGGMPVAYHWNRIALFGLLAVGVFACVFTLLPFVPARDIKPDRRKDEVYSLIHLSRQPADIFPDDSQKTEPSPAQLEIVQHTQIVFLKSRAILRAVMQYKEVTELDLIKRQKDPVAWLEENLKVEPFGSPLLIRIALAGEDRDALKVVVNEITREYVIQVHRTRRSRLDELEGVKAQYEEKLSTMRRDYYTLKASVMPNEANRRILLEDYDAYSKHLRQLEFARVSAESQLQTLQSRKQTDSETGNRIKQLNEEIGRLTAERKLLAPNIERLKSEIDRFGLGSVRLEMSKEQIETMKSVVDRLRTLVEHARINIEAREVGVSVFRMAE
jgi:hypothetical protein